MNRTLAMMIRLQRLTLHASPLAAARSVVKRVLRLRGRITGEYLRRFDQLLERRRVAVAPISKSGTCGACHLRLPVGDLWLAREASGMMTSCPHCGCFLYDGRKKPRESKIAA